MDRIINVKVGGNYIIKDNKNAGVTGEGNVTNLRITFDEGWDGYAKTVTFWDARGNNPVKRLLTTNLLENMVQSMRVYLVSIPADALAIEGELTFVIDGYKGEFAKDEEGNDVLPKSVEGKRQRSLSESLVVKYAPMTDNAGEPADPEPTKAEELQGEIDAIAGLIHTVAVNAENALKSAESAKEAEDTAIEKALEASGSAVNAGISAKRAEDAVGKTNYIGENGNWYAWDSSISTFYDTEVKAQAGSTVYCGDAPPPEADVWINPKGVYVVYATLEELEAVRKTILDLTNKVAPSPASITLYADRWEQNEEETRYHQEVVVANANITEYSKIDLQLSAEQIAIFYEKDLAFVAENDGGVVTVFCIGQVPEHDYVIQATVSEVLVNVE